VAFNLSTWLLTVLATTAADVCSLVNCLISCTYTMLVTVWWSNKLWRVPSKIYKPHPHCERSIPWEKLARPHNCPLCLLLLLNYLLGQNESVKGECCVSINEVHHAPCWQASLIREHRMSVHSHPSLPSSLPPSLPPSSLGHTPTLHFHLSPSVAGAARRLTTELPCRLWIDTGTWSRDIRKY